MTERPVADDAQGRGSRAAGAPSVPRPGHLIAAGCFALLSAMRFADGATVWAGVFVVLALLNVLVGFTDGPVGRRPARGSFRRGGGSPAVVRQGGTDAVADGSPSARAPATGPRPSRAQLQHTHDVFRSRLRVWSWTAGAGALAAAATMAVFPPMSALLAALALGAALRGRRYRRSLATLRGLLASR